MLSDEQIIAKYGQPGDPTKLAVIDLPYPMRIAWDLTKTVTHMQCHQLLTGKFLNVFDDLQAHYGLPQLQALGIDLFGGCFNVRLMRGSKTKWSRHSWGIAIDLDPARNGLKVKSPIAQFSHIEYKAMIDIFYAHDFEGLGREENRDWMHFQAKI